MKPSVVKDALKQCIAANRPTHIWGPPGVGKSQVVAQVATELKLDLIDVRAVLLDPVDLRGLPKINNDGMAHWCPPAFLPREGKGILFLDELNAAPPLVQAACYQLILDRKLGEYELPEGWVILAAGNRETDRAVTSRMSSALANRFVHIYFDVDVSDWIDWALDKGLTTELISFIRFRPGLLHSFDPKKNEKAFPTPRSWEFVSDVLQAGNSNIELELSSGIVGEGAATELMAFLKIYRNLPDPDVILLDPKAAKVPEDPATLYAICGSLSNKASDQNFGRVITYANRLPDEFSVLLVRDAVKRDNQLSLTRAFVEWTSVHNDILI